MSEARRGEQNVDQENGEHSSLDTVSITDEATAIQGNISQDLPNATPLDTKAAQNNNTSSDEVSSCCKASSGCHGASHDNSTTTTTSTVESPSPSTNDLNEDEERSLIDQKIREDLFIKELQNALDTVKSNIKIFSMYRVTKHFDARIKCGKRSYQYLIPIKYLSPSKVVSNDDSDGFKYFMKLTPEEREFEVSSKQESWDCATHKTSCRSQAGLSDSEAVFDDTTSVDTKKASHQLTKYDYWKDTSFGEEICEEMKQKILGTRKYHNFTSRVDPTDSNLWRFIESIEVERKQILEWDMLVVKIKGQSFLLNQIRKMVGLVIEMIRGTAPDWAIIDTTNKTLKRWIHMAPSQGLFLDRVYYDSYNEKQANPPVTPYLNFEDIASDVERFQNDVIYPTIIRHYHHLNEQLWKQWIFDIDRHPYCEENYPPRKLLMNRKKIETIITANEDLGLVDDLN